MGGLFGGSDDPPPAPTRSPKGVKITKISGDPDTILRRNVDATGTTRTAGTSLMTEEDAERRRRERLLYRPDGGM